MFIGDILVSGRALNNVREDDKIDGEEKFIVIVQPLRP